MHKWDDETTQVRAENSPCPTADNYYRRRRCYRREYELSEKKPTHTPLSNVFTVQTVPGLCGKQQITEVSIKLINTQQQIITQN